jgi:hypothetical protein
MQPRLFFKKSDEEKILDAKIPKSANKVEKVGYTYKDDKGLTCKQGSKRTEIAYLKTIGKKPGEIDRIPALYEAAFSVFARLPLRRVADNRLAYNGDKLVGMASVELPGFVPMQIKNDPDCSPSEKEKQRITNPTRETLLKENAGELLACCFCDKNTDPKFDNVNFVKGIIDLGQFFYQLMSVFQAKTLITEFLEYEPLASTKITTAGIRNLLNKAEALERRYWPTKEHIIEHILPTALEPIIMPNKTLKAIEAFKSLPEDLSPRGYTLCLMQDMQDSEILREEVLYLSEKNGKIICTVITPEGKTVKDFPTEIKAPIPFTLQALAPLKHIILEATTKAGYTLPHYKTQVLVYLLKKLLSFNKEVLRKRLSLYLGDEPLGLDELSSVTRENLINYDRDLFYDGERERTFAEHCLLFFETQHTELLTELIHMPEFREFLFKNPVAILEIKDWFIKQNEDKDNIACQHAPYDLDYIDHEYHRLYRTSYVRPICKHLSDFESFIESLKPDIIKSYEMIDKPKESKENKSHNVAVKKIVDLDQSIIYVSKLPAIKIKSSPEKIEESKSQDKKNYQILVSLYSTLLNLTRNYYKLQNPTREDNHTYIHHMKELLQEKYGELSGLSEHENVDLIHITEKFKKTLSSFAMKDVDDPPELSESFMVITKENLNISEEIDEAMKAKISECESKEVVICTNREQGFSFAFPFLNFAKNISSFESKPSCLKQGELIALLSQFTSARILELSHEKINALITRSRKEYEPYSSYFNYRFHTSKRSDKIIELQKNYRSTSLLQEILAEGGWEETSFNTKLIKNLCLDMLEHYNNEKDASRLIEKNISHRGSQIEALQLCVNDKSFFWSTIAKHIAKNIQREILSPKEASLILVGKGRKIASPLS